MPVSAIPLSKRHQPSSLTPSDVGPLKSQRRVFRKSTRNHALEVYVFKRDFYEENGTVEPIDGLIAVNPDKDLNDRAVFVKIEARFHHSFASAAAILGISPSTTLHRDTKLVYRGSTSAERSGSDAEESTALLCDKARSEYVLEKMKTPTKLQAKLAKTLDWPTVPFRFQIPSNLPSSVVMNHGKGREDDSGHLGVDYEISAFVGLANEGKPRKRRSTVTLNIRKLTQIHHLQELIPPSVSESMSFILSSSSKSVTLQVTLTKPLYTLDEKVGVTLNITNSSNKTIKSIKILVRQHSSLKDLNGSERINAKCILSEMESTEECPIRPSQTKQLNYELEIFDLKNKDHPQIALDGQLHDEDTTIATSTKSLTATDNDVVRGGVHVGYEVKVKLSTGKLGSDIVCRVPFVVSRPRVDFREFITRFSMNGSIDTTPTFDEPDIQDSELVFEDFIKGRAEKLFGDNFE